MTASTAISQFHDAIEADRRYIEVINGWLELRPLTEGEERSIALTKERIAHSEMCISQLLLHPELAQAGITVDTHTKES